MKHRILFALAALVVWQAGATSLSSQLNEDGIREAGKILGWGSAHRAWTAPAVQSDGLGLSLGVEADFVPRRDLLDFGDGTGVVPRIVPVPRIWAAWAFPADFAISMSFAPGMIFDGISAFGIGGQWTFLRDDGFNLSALIDYTYASSFGDLFTHTTDVMFQVSRDLVSWQPYFGIGFLVTNVTVRDELAAAGTKAGPYTLPALHLVLGVQIDNVAKLATQIDFTGMKQSFGLVFINSF